MTSVGKPEDPDFLPTNFLIKVKFRDNNNGQWWELHFEAKQEKAKEIHRSFENINE